MPSYVKSTVHAWRTCEWRRRTHTHTHLRYCTEWWAECSHPQCLSHATLNTSITESSVSPPPAVGLCAFAACSLFGMGGSAKLLPDLPFAETAMIPGVQVPVVFAKCSANVSKWPPTPCFSCGCHSLFQKPSGLSARTRSKGHQHRLTTEHGRRYKAREDCCMPWC